MGWQDCGSGVDDDMRACLVGLAGPAVALVRPNTSEGLEAIERVGIRRVPGRLPPIPLLPAPAASYTCRLRALCPLPGLVALLRHRKKARAKGLAEEGRWTPQPPDPSPGSDRLD